ncbi:phosphohydrolase [Geoglobus acetivorans]|uniref:Phosphohydrolase n=1 Tax=Geoglobus acetivorans TaxID=565033 RepID=A0A0A7GEE8_GEOAI|nr:phosphohydrolase [Geoglobus acetivorans]
MKNIHDSIHGTIRLEDWMVEVIDTPEFQRLRRIKQLGFADLVYPGANHTRFEHSIGTLHVAKMLTDDAEILASALLHDIGHTPFSHSGEGIVRKYLGKEHEDVVDILKGSRIREILEKNGMDWKNVAKGILKPPVSSVIDVDRIDYLMRDSHYTGVAYGIVDFDRLIKTLEFDGENVYVSIKGVRAIESLLISRYLMYSAVYHHHVCRIAKKMFEKAVEWMISENEIDPKKLVEMDDHDVVSAMRNSCGFPKEMVSRLDTRRLYKRAVYAPKQDVGVNIEKIDTKRAEREIAEIAGLDEQEVIVDVPEYRSEDYDIPVYVNGEFVSVEEISPLVRALKNAHMQNWRMGVYCPAEHVDSVRKVSVEYFDINTSTQRKLSDILDL